MRFTIYLAIYFIHVNALYAQPNVRILGVVVDKDTGEGIPYAHVLVNNGAEGTVANNEGRFQLAIEVVDADPYLIFSSIGFQRDSVQVSKIPETGNFKIALEAKVVMLEPVEISSRKLIAAQIVEEAANRIKVNYFQDAYNQELFYRTQVRRNDSIIFNEEASILIYDRSGYQPKAKATASMFGEILQFRNTTNNQSKDPWFGVGSLWKLFSHDLILDKDNILNRANSYTTEITNIIEQNGETIYEISFSCKKPNAFTTGFGFPDPVRTYGRLYINETDFAILKYEHCIQRGTYAYKKVGLRDENWSVMLVQSYKKYQGKYFLHHSKQLHARDVVTVRTQERNRVVEIYDLLSSKIDIEAKRKISKPLDKLLSGPSVPFVNDFWKKHNLVLQDPSVNSHCFD